MASALHSPSGGSRGVVMVDVARLAGVSQKTVSRVVNGAPHVRPDVRERGVVGLLHYRCPWFTGVQNDGMRFLSSGEP